MALAWLVAAVPLVPQEAEAQAREYELKAAFLLSFAKFVEWPEEAFPTPLAPIVLAVAGEDPFGAVLDRAVAGHTAQGRAFVVRRFRSADRLEACHILFIPGSENADEWIEALDRLPLARVLTVGEGDAFRQHGAIAFLLQEKSVRLAVNLDAVGEAELRVSSRLLAVAQVVSRRWKEEER